MKRKSNQSKNQSNAKIQKILNSPQDVEFGIDDAPDFIIPCPKCEKRAIDVVGRPERTIKVRHKCPHCRNIVVTAILAANRRC